MPKLIHSSPDPILFEAAVAAMRQAYAPYSNFSVGAAVRAVDGRIFAGCNVENAAYGLCLCAEANALSTAVTQGAREFTEALVVIPGDRVCSPCGSCRQRLAEMAGDDALVYLCAETGRCETYRLGDLMPVAFRSDYLEK